MVSTAGFQDLINNELEQFCQDQTGKPVELYEPLKYVLSLGGKRIRPLFTLLAYDLFGSDVLFALKPAIGIELFHNFSLIHDDIMDKAPLRRNRMTVHEKWNPGIAILSGDAMLVKAYQLICHCRNMDVLEVFSETALRVCEGQQMDMNFEKAVSVSIPQYIRMIELKTASLLAVSLKIGAILAGATEKVAGEIYEFGKHIGIAFQIQDDLLDAYGVEEKFGKQNGGDIARNKKTFLLLKALELSRHNGYKNEELRQWIYSPVSDVKQKVEAVTAIYDFLNIRKLAQDESMSYYTKGIGFLDGIRVDDEKKQNLIEFVENFLNRET